MGSLQVLTDERNKFLEQARKLDEAVVVLGGPSAFGDMPATTTKRRARAPASAAAQARRRTRINTKKVDHFVLQALIDFDGEDAPFMSGKQIIEAVSKAGGPEINGIQMRSSFQRLADSNKAADNGEARAKKKYKATTSINDITFEESDTSTSATSTSATTTTSTAKAAKKATSGGAGNTVTEPSTVEGENNDNDNDNFSSGDDVAGALDASGTSGITAKNAIVMALSVVPDGLGLGDLVKKVLETFPGKFSESTLKSGVSTLAKNGDISSKKKGKNNIYLLKPAAA